MKKDLDSQVEKLLEMQEDLKHEIKDINVTLIKQSMILEEHTRRSLANEEAVELLRDHMAPIEKHILLVNTLTKAALAIGGVVGFLASVAKIVEFFHS